MTRELVDEGKPGCTNEIHRLRRALIMERISIAVMELVTWVITKLMMFRLSNKVCVCEFGVHLPFNKKRAGEIISYR